MGKNLYISSLLDVYGEFLSEKQRKITEHYYNDDLSLSEIAENEGITRQGVSDLIRRTEAQLTAFEEKCCYCKRFLKLKELAGNIKDTDNADFKEIIDIIDKL
jgi:predicted DNA-binding protein YlxM (UPF0122 family)